VSTLGVVIASISSVSTIAASTAAVFAVFNHKKVGNVQATVNGRLGQVLEMLANATEALAVSERLRHEANNESKDKGFDNTTDLSGLRGYV
jgi:hypothetical protein